MPTIKTETQPRRSHVATQASARAARAQPDVDDLSAELAGLGLRAQSNGPIEVFIHGSAPGNGQAGVTGAYACMFPDYPECDDAQPVANEDDPTGPRMSLLAATLAIHIVDTAIDPTFERPLRVITNDENLKKSFTIWIEKWKKNGWKTSSKKPVENRDLIEPIDLNPRKRIEWLVVAQDFSTEDDDEQQRVERYHNQVIRRAQNTAP